MFENTSGKNFTVFKFRKSDYSFISKEVVTFPIGISNYKEYITKNTPILNSEISVFLADGVEPILLY